MTDPSPVPPTRPRLVDIAYWCWLLAGILLVAFGLLLGSTRGDIPLFLRGFGILFAVSGLVLGFFAGKMRNGHPGFRRAALGLALGLVVLLVMFTLVSRGGVWLIVMIPTAAGAILLTRPDARAFYEQEGRE
ncbi:Uncharacterised protein [Mycolicibacterium vanbaalenii]|uniref:Transmembrane protein n=1 Tax=Mycolicibacterium vanbaalenii TaxID=110539 RepID=A0A5S9PZ35_MYCVN|nr:hypothetical protein [Mycolicibacterium vanbaalenii]CAA0109984.1 Uncharacterised protein [Mycolicibacterium vanbaalenii]